MKWRQKSKSKTYFKLFNCTAQMIFSEPQIFILGHASGEFYGFHDVDDVVNSSPSNTCELKTLNINVLYLYRSTQ